jgi:hypothetical protein
MSYRNRSCKRLLSVHSGKLNSKMQTAHVSVEAGSETFVCSRCNNMKSYNATIRAVCLPADNWLLRADRAGYSACSSPAPACVFLHSTHLTPFNSISFNSYCFLYQYHCSLKLTSLVSYGPRSAKYWTTYTKESRVRITLVECSLFLCFAV